jgi:hypothetical protein
VKKVAGVLCHANGLRLFYFLKRLERYVFLFAAFSIAALLRNAGKSLDIRTNPASRSDAAINWIGK